MAEPPKPRRQVQRRRVFYVPGFDPFPPRRYRELYRKEGHAQAAISGYDLALSGQAAAPKARFGWQVETVIQGRATTSRIEVLAWSDIVRRSMALGLLATYGALLRTAWTYLASGALPRLMGLRKGPVIAALYPVLALLGQFALALAAARLFTGLLGLEGPLAWGLGAAVLWAVLELFRRLDRHIFAHYLMHDFAFAARGRGAYGPDLDQRITEFAKEIAEALGQGDLDEVLVVGHSSGAYIAVSALTEALAALERSPRPALAFLSLGQVVPMVSFLPQAHRLRRDLQILSEHPDITWVDISAPGDGCTFALCDPVAVSGVARPAQRGPLVRSAAFTRTLSPARWKALRWRFFRLHFQYLCAFDQPGHYDYFQITAGPLTLAARYEAQSPSPGLIRRAVNRHVATGR